MCCTHLFSLAKSGKERFWLERLLSSVQQPYNIRLNVQLSLDIRYIQWQQLYSAQQHRRTALNQSSLSHSQVGVGEVTVDLSGIVVELDDWDPSVEHFDDSVGWGHERSHHFSHNIQALLAKHAFVLWATLRQEAELATCVSLLCTAEPQRQIISQFNSLSQAI